MSRRPAWWLRFLKTVWPITYLSARFTRVPLLGGLFYRMVRPLFTGRNFNVTHIPVDETVKGAESMALPRRVLEELIRRSSHRVIIRRCTCRDEKGCGSYPVEDACLLIGADTGQIDERIAKHLSVDEAVGHMERMIGLGLVPMVGRVRMDDFFYGVPNRGRMLTVCFCCSCCCTIFRSARFFPAEVGNSLVRVKGLIVAVHRERCRACGECINACFMRARAIEDGRVLIDQELCKGCGRCAAVCPHQAASVEVRDVGEAADEIIGRIGRIVNIE